MKNNYPLVSIVIPVYNGANYLKEAIESALSQTYKNIEIIIVDDGSSDQGKTKKVVEKFGDKIKYIYKKNGGVSSALNLGIKIMNGEYFSWLSHDDMFFPNHIETQINFIQESGNPELIVYGGYYFVDEKGFTKTIVNPEEIALKKQLNNTLFPIFRYAAHSCSLLFHKNHFKRVGIFNEELLTTQDTEFKFRLFRNAETKFVPGLYVKVRQHDERGSKTNVNHLKNREETLMEMYNKITDKEKEDMYGSKLRFYFEQRASHRNNVDKKAYDLMDFNYKKELYNLSENKISVIIISRKKSKVKLLNTINSLINNDYKNIEIIVMSFNEIKEDIKKIIGSYNLKVSYCLLDKEESNKHFKTELTKVTSNLINLLNEGDVVEKNKYVLQIANLIYKKEFITISKVKKQRSLIFKNKTKLSFILFEKSYFFFNDIQFLKNKKFNSYRI